MFWKWLRYGLLAIVGVDGDCRFNRDRCNTGGEAQQPANSC